MQWRDELVAGGWTGKPIAAGGPRLDAFCQIEAHDNIVLPPGFSDRFARVARQVRCTQVTGLNDIRLAQPRTSLVAPWPRLFTLLSDAGVQIIDAEPLVANAEPGSDLGVLQRAILDNTTADPGLIKGDGSLILARGRSPGEAASGLAAWMQQQDRAPWPLDVCVVRGTQSSALDDALVRFGIPSLGSVSSSPWRPALQVLPLVLSQLWAPKDPQRMLELLSLPTSPLRRRLRTALMDALAEAPGIGGTTWTKAWKSVAADAEKPESVEAQVDRWLSFDAHDPDEGAPAEIIIQIATQIADWARGRAAVTEDEVQRGALATAAAQARQLRELVTDWARDPVTRPDLEQLLEAVTRGGSTRILRRALSGSDPVVDSPGAVIEPVSSVIWWGFVHSAADAIPTSPWRESERAACVATDIDLPDPITAQRARTAAWLRPILSAKQQLLLVHFETCDGESEGLHPVWDEIEGRLQLTGADLARLTVDWTNQLAAAEHPEGRVAVVPLLPSRLIESRKAAEPRALWRIDPELLPPREVESASSLDKLFGCPLAWTLQYRAALRSAGVPSLAVDNRLFGTLGHQLIEELLLQDPTDLPEPDDARARLEQRFDETVDGEAAILMLPGFRETLADVRFRIARAGATLVRALRAGGYSVEGCEVDVGGVPFAETTLTGAADLLLSHPKRGRVIVDLKWSGLNYRTKELAEGRALQLAVYSHALKRKRSKKLPPSAFFILYNAQFLTVYPGLFDGAVVVDGPTLDETLEKAEQTYGETRKDLDEGVVAVPPFLDEEDPMSIRRADYPLALEPPCRFCDFDTVCGKAIEGEA